MQEQETTVETTPDEADAVAQENNDTLLMWRHRNRSLCEQLSCLIEADKEVWGEHFTPGEAAGEELAAWRAHYRAMARIYNLMGREIG
jgi:hypothetical protein